jgi:glycogen(starch) synthase
LSERPVQLRTLQLGLGWFPEHPGGLDRFYYELVRYLPRVGVGVFGLVAGPPDVSRLTGGRVEAFASRSSHLPVRLWKARRAVRRALDRDPSLLVVSHCPLHGFPSLDLLGGRPLVIHFQGPWGLEARAEGAPWFAVRAKLALERVVYRRGTAFVVLSEAFRQLLADLYGVPPERIRVIPGGVDADRFSIGLSRAEARAALGWPSDRPIVLTVRRLVRRMGLEDLIAATAAVRRRVPDLLVLIAGRGPLSLELESRIRAAGLDGHMRLVGFLPDDVLPHAYTAADLTVVPSVALEGFGLVVAESLAAGTPTLVTPVGGLPEAVRALSRDLIVPEAGPKALADGITAALTGKLRLPDAAVCQRFARERYDWPVIAGQVRTVYEAALR